MYAMGQTTFAPVSPRPFRPLDAPQVYSTFFEQAEASGVPYRRLAQPSVLPVKGAMVGWKVRSGPSGHDPIDFSVTEVAELTPYVEATGPTDPGDGFRWIEKRIVSGRGVIMVPPVGWQPTDDLMRQTTGAVRLVASERAEDLAQHAHIDSSGFVIVDPQGGWKAPASSIVTPEKKALPKWVLPVGIGVAALTIGAIAYAGLRRR